MSSRFDTLDTQTKRILEAILSINESLSQDIVKSLALLICRSDCINKDAHHRTRQMIADLKNDISSQFSPMSIITDLKNYISSQFSPMGVITAQVEMLNVGPERESQLRDVVNRTILEQLSYPHMTNRYEEIQEAHSKTFEWIFRRAEQSDLPWNDFSKWLRQDANIYWINGKAGSGKSTLMKYIYDSRHTAEYLREWGCKRLSITSQCCIASFFFWNSGTDMQKSQQGLLRSLLFQVLGHNPNLIPLVLPAQWAEHYHKPSILEHQIKPKIWSLREAS